MTDITITFDANAVPLRADNGRIGPRTREAWLKRVADELRPLLLAAGGTLPDKIRYSCGWPTESRGGKIRVGECHYREASADESVEVFISPVLGDGLKAADTLAHELIHACLPMRDEDGRPIGHGPRFAKLATAFGLVGKMTEAGAGPELLAKLQAITDAIGPYPHAELRTGEVADKPKKQKSRQLKVQCPECEDPYICRMSAATIARGLPTCPCGAEMVPEKSADDPEEGE